MPLLSVIAPTCKKTNSSTQPNRSRRFTRSESDGGRKKPGSTPRGTTSIRVSGTPCATSPIRANAEGVSNLVVGFDANASGTESPSAIGRLTVDPAPGAAITNVFAAPAAGARSIGEPILTTTSATSPSSAVGNPCSTRSSASGNMPPIRDHGPLKGSSRTLISMSARRAAARQ